MYTSPLYYTIPVPLHVAAVTSIIILSIVPLHVAAITSIISIVPLHVATITYIITINNVVTLAYEILYRFFIITMVPLHMATIAYDLYSSTSFGHNNL